MLCDLSGGHSIKVTIAALQDLEQTLQEVMSLLSGHGVLLCRGRNSIIFFIVGCVVVIGEYMIE